MTLRLILVALVQEPWQVLAIQVLDGLAQGLFIVVAAAWMTDRLADHKRLAEAQVLVGSALVAGSAIGPTLSGLVVDAVSYRGMFWLLAGIGMVATMIVVVFVPESLKAGSASSGVEPLTDIGLRAEADAVAGLFLSERPCRSTKK
jgi:MFS family permease